MTHNTKYIQTSNLKLIFKKLRSIIGVFQLNQNFPIRYSTYYGKWKTNTYFVPSKLYFAVKKGPLDIECTISCKKDQICCFTISPVLWCVFYKNCSRKFVKDFGDCRSDVNRSSGFSGWGSNGAVCFAFFVSVRKSSSTNQNIFFLLEMI